MKPTNRHDDTRTKAVLYARVSTPDQESEGYSIPAQLDLVRDYAARRGLEIAAEFVDVESAKGAGRQEFGQMIAFLREHPEVRAIVVEKQDRLSRNFRDIVTLDELDVELHFVKEGSVVSDGSTSHEKLVYGLKVVLAKSYSDNLSEEVRKGMREKARQGYWPSSAPIGYRNSRDASDRRVIELDPEKAPFVARAFELAASGVLSLKEIARTLKDEGFRSRGGARVSKSSIHAMLRNPLYKGQLQWGGEVFDGAHAAIVPPSVWNAAQDALDGRAARNHHRVRHDFAYSRLLSCGRCGCTIVGERKKGKYVYYRCTHGRGECDEPYVREEVLDAAFAEQLRALAFGPDVAEWVADALRESHEDERRFHDEAITRMGAEAKRIQGRLDQMYLDKLDGRITAEFFDAKAAEWRRDRERLREQIAEHDAASESYMDTGVQILELARRAPELFEAQQGAEKRRLLRFLLSNCTWADGELCAELRQPFDLIAVAASAPETRPALVGATEGRLEAWLPRQDSNLE